MGSETFPRAKVVEGENGGVPLWSTGVCPSPALDDSIPHPIPGPQPSQHQTITIGLGSLPVQCKASRSLAWESVTCNVSLFCASPLFRDSFLRVAQKKDTISPYTQPP